MERLAGVQERLRDGDLRGAVAACLEAWRHNRSVVIAQALERLTAQVWQEGPPHRLRSGLGYDDDWRALAARADAAEVGWLASTLYARLPVKSSALPSPGVRDAAIAAMEARVRALEPHLPDPRVAAAFLWLLRNGPGWQALPARQRLDWMRWALARVEAAGDPRSEGVIYGDRRPGSWGEVAAGPRPAPWVVVPLAPDEQAGWRAIGRPPPVDVGPLIEAVAAHPDDDGPRRVVAEVLQAHGHDRGEFIALQLGPRSDENDRRIRALLQRGRADWLGELPSKILVNTVFERGFVWSAELGRDPHWTEEAWREAAASPVWATLRTLRRGTGSTERYLALLRSPALRNLERVEAAPGVIRELVARQLAPAIRALELQGLPKAGGLAELLGGAPALDTLRIGGVVSAELTVNALVQAGWGPRLRRLELGAEASPRTGALAKELFAKDWPLVALQERWVGFDDQCFVALGPQGGRFHFRRIPGGLNVDLWAWAQAFPPEVQRVVVDEGPNARFIETALRARGLVVERSP